MLRVYRLAVIAALAHFAYNPDNNYEKKSTTIKIYPILLVLEPLYTLLIIFRWESIKKYAPLIETLFCVSELFLYNILLA
jgi:hypothetical protein